MNTKKKYIEFCAQNESIVPVYLQPYWLDVVAEKWDVVTIERAGKTIAALPFCIKGKFLTQRIYLPALSFYQSFITIETLSAIEVKKCVEELLKKLPVTFKSYLKLLPQYSTLSLEKSGFKKEEYPNYILQPQKINFELLCKNHQRNITKGISKNYSITESTDINKSYELLMSTFKKQQKKHPADSNSFKKIYDVIRKNNSGNLLDCKDANGNLIASIFILKDKTSYYYSLGGYDTIYKNSGGMTYLLWHAIQLSKKKNLIFNFCGSSKKSIATFFEGFGADKISIAVWKKSIL